MEPIDEPKQIQVHAFVCTNERPAPKAACHAVGGHEFFAKLKEKLKADGVYSTHKVTRTGCLGYCNNEGCVVAIYRKNGESTWLTEVKAADFDSVYQKITGK
jgi:(2Fe-2S) ferredoxin